MSYRPNPLKQTFHNTRRFFARSWLSFMPAVQIAITGSQGKTNTSSTLFHLLSRLAPTVRTDLNLDTLYNVPITALHVTPRTKYAIFELGVDHKGEMDSHLGIVRPKIAVITGISPVHTDAEHLGSFENLIAEKRKLIEALPADGYAVLNGDDENVRAMAPYTKAKVIFYGKNVGNDVQAKDIGLSLEGTSFSILDKQQSGAVLNIRTRLIGLHHIYNIMTSYIVYRLLGYDGNDKFESLMATLAPLAGRMSLEKGPLGTTVLDDSLRANPASTTSGLLTFSQLKTDGKKIAVLAEMGELEKPEEEHAKIGRLLAGLNIDYVFAIGNLHTATVKEAVAKGFPPDRIILAADVLKAAEEIRKIVCKGDVIYLKGSLLRHIERVTMILNGEKVGCNVVSCPFYHHCPRCRYLAEGYSGQ